MTTLIKNYSSLILKKIPAYDTTMWHTGNSSEYSGLAFWSMDIFVSIWWMELAVIVKVVTGKDNLCTILKKLFEGET